MRAVPEAKTDARTPFRRYTAWLTVPVIVGLLDSASFLMYLFGLPEMPFYATILGMKFALLWIARVELNAARPALPFVIVTLLAIFFSTVVNDVEPLSVYKALAVLVSLLLTLVVIRRDLRGYAMGLSITGALICVIYIAQAQLGMIGNHFGRMLFLGDSHPNLGGEMLGMIVIMSALCLSPRLYFSLASAAGYCVWLMQSRAGLLAILISVFVYALFNFAKTYGWMRCFVITAFGVIILIAVILAGIASGSPLAISVYEFFWNTLFLANDVYRGVGTGMSGRADHWAEAVRIFLEHTLFGAGLEYSARLNVIQPHNWFLYALAQFGILGILVAFTYVVALARAMWARLSNVVVILPTLLLLLINDRFLNLNIYPLGMYVLVFVTADASGRRLFRL